MPILFALEATEKEIILDHVKETFDVMEYPTSLVFSSISRLSIISFLRGRGGIDFSHIESVAVDVFRQLSEYASKDEQYRWFELWSYKMIKSSKDRRVHTS